MSDTDVCDLMEMFLILLEDTGLICDWILGGKYNEENHFRPRQLSLWLHGPLSSEQTAPPLRLDPRFLHRSMFHPVSVSLTI